MNNFEICQRIYDNMEHPDYYDEPKNNDDDWENWTDEELQEYKNNHGW